MGSSGFSWKLADHPELPKGKTVAVVVLDGWGEAKPDQYNCIHVAETPTMDSLKKGDPDKWRFVRAHGSAVGLPTEDDMGNSEVGHNALGAGRIFAQGAKLVDQALESGKIYDGEGFKYISECFEKGTLHLIGLLSDGGVHSRLDQLLLLLKGSGEHGAKRIRVHILTDGRDVLDGSSVGFVETLENYLAELREKGVDAQIASGGGRTYVTMDRYEAVPEILLHFLSGVPEPQTMQVIGLICGRKLRTLIDSGSTLNFVSFEFAKRMGYSATPTPAFEVMVANGERLRCDEIYLDVPMEIQGYKFRTDMFPLDLKGSDVVLGIQWLQGLGPVLHDWQKLSMEFSVEGQKFVIQREDTGGIFQESENSIIRLASNSVKFCIMPILVHAPFKFGNAVEAVKKLRQAPKASDQYLPPFVIADDNGKPVGPIVDGDAVVTINFRADRMVMVAKAFEYEDFDKFDRVRVPKIRYAGMVQYDGELKLLSHYLVSPPEIDGTSGEYLVHNGIRTFACSETVKFGHVTFFWNGNRSGYFNEELEEYVEIPSDSGITFSVQPKMKALEIGEKVRDAILSGKFDQMILDAIEQVGGIYVVTADHGNAEDMVKRNKTGQPLLDKTGKIQILTSHTCQPVPIAIGGPGLAPGCRFCRDVPTGGLANVAATVMNLHGFEAPSDYKPTLVEAVSRAA